MVIFAEVKREKHIAVITSDIVNSSDLNSKHLGEIRHLILGLKHESILLKPEFYRGDSFQLAVKQLNAAEVALKYRTAVIEWNDSVDLRISIGLGSVSSWKENVLLSGGTAFERSGKMLDQMKQKEIRLAIITGDKELNDELETYCFLIDTILNAMTSAQANALFYKLEGYSQLEISEKLQISQPAVSKTLKAANWKAVDKFLQRYRQIIEKNYGGSE